MLRMIWCNVINTRQGSKRSAFYHLCTMRSRRDTLYLLGFHSCKIKKIMPPKLPHWVDMRVK